MPKIFHGSHKNHLPHPTPPPPSIPSPTYLMYGPSDNKVNNNSIFNKRYAEFSTKWWVLVHFHNTTCACNHPLQSPPKIRSSTSANFHLLILLLIVHKIVLSIPTNSSFLYTSAIFHLPIFAYYHPNNLHQKCFPHLSHLANSG